MDILCRLFNCHDASFDGEYWISSTGRLVLPTLIIYSAALALSELLQQLSAPLLAFVSLAHEGSKQNESRMDDESPVKFVRAKESDQLPCRVT